MARPDAQLNAQMAQLAAFLRVYWGGPDREGRTFTAEDAAGLAAGRSILAFTPHGTRRPEAAFCPHVERRVDRLQPRHVALNIQAALAQLTAAQRDALERAYGPAADNTERPEELSSGRQYRLRERGLMRLARMFWQDSGEIRVP